MKPLHIGFAAFGALFGLVTVAAVVPVAIENAACTAGNQYACTQIKERAERIKNKKAAEDAAYAKRRADYLAAKAEREAQPWQPTRSNVSKLAFACEQKIKPVLKDPGSFRRLNEGMSKLTDTHVTVFVRYTATNSFNARIQDVQTCTYTR